MLPPEPVEGVMIPFPVALVLRLQLVTEAVPVLATPKLRASGVLTMMREAVRLLLKGKAGIAATTTRCDDDRRRQADVTRCCRPEEGGDVVGGAIHLIAEQIGQAAGVHPGHDIHDRTRVPVALECTNKRFRRAGYCCRAPAVVVPEPERKPRYPH